MIPATLILSIALQLGEAPGQSVRDPAIASDGRIAVSVLGDLWVRSAPPDTSTWLAVTDGPAWDRHPAWTLDGTALVFTSDRSGSSDIWRVSVGPRGAIGAPEQLTTSAEREARPTAASAGIVFERGYGPTTRLWIRSERGEERRLTGGSGTEREPAASSDGERIAFVQTGPERQSLRIHWMVHDSTSTVLSNRPVELPSWAPDGERLTFTSRRGELGVWVTPTDGSYVNLLSKRPAQSVWSPDGRTVLLAELPGPDPTYNGDPDRLGERDVDDLFPSPMVVWWVDAPATLDQGPGNISVNVVVDRASKNSETFEKIWSRVNDLYYAASDASQRRRRWEELRTKYHPLAREARSEEELATVMHRLLADRPPLRAPASGRAAVSSAHPVATEAGLEILRAGGNVVDAAVAVSFALGVVEPDASGIGGYGEMLIYRPGMTEPALIEFMTKAPEEASLLNAALLENGEYPDDGPVLANVPGAIAGMHLAFEKFGSGKLQWADLIEPAIHAAENGFAVSDGFATTLARERERYLKYAGPTALFFKNGEPLQAGDTLRNQDLAWALRQIAEQGPRAFYGGEVGRRMVEDLRGKGNAMRMRDLERYFAIERAPTITTYRGHTVYSSAPPANGGLTLSAMLNHFEQVPNPRPYTEDAPTLHAMIEAWKLTPSGFQRIADPGLWPVETQTFVSKDSARVRWRCFDANRALTPGDVRGDSLPCLDRASATTEDGSRTGTTSFAVADARGNVVAVTQTLGTWGGNFYVTPGLGFIYNDKLTSYASDPDRFGARLAHARHSTSITPTIVFRGTDRRMRPVLATGAAGNRWITSAVYSIVTGVVDQRLPPQHAIELPRFLLTQRGNNNGPNGREFVVQIEGGLAPGVKERLEHLGHTVQVISLKGELRMGYAAAIALEDGVVTAGADPRRAGAAGAIP